MIHKTLINSSFFLLSFSLALNFFFFQQIISVFHVPQAKLEILLVARTVLRDSTKIQQLKQFALIVTKEKLLPKDLLPVKYVLPANMFQQKVAKIVSIVHKDGNVPNQIHLQHADNVIWEKKLLPMDLLPVKHVLPGNMFQQKVATYVSIVHKDGNVRNLIHLQLANNVIWEKRLLPKDLLPVKHVLLANMFQQKVAKIVLNVHKDGNVPNQIHLHLVNNVKQEKLQLQQVQNRAVNVILDIMVLHLANVLNVHH